MPAIRNIEGVGLVGADDGEGEGYVIVELQIDSGSDRARLFRVRTSEDHWIETDPRNPLPARDKEWVPGGVVSLGGKLYWLDLSWGILICDPFVDASDLPFRSLPPGRVLDLAPPHIHAQQPHHHGFTVSRGGLRYVEIIAEDGDNGEAERVFISNDNSYKKTWLPKEAGLVIVYRSNPDLVYFALEQLGKKSSQILEKMGSTSPLTRHGREEKFGQIDGSGWGRREGAVYTGQLSAGHEHIFSVNIRVHQVLEFAEEPHELMSKTSTRLKFTKLTYSVTLKAMLLKDFFYHIIIVAAHNHVAVASIKVVITIYACYCFLNCANRLIFNSPQMEDRCDRVHKNKGFLCDKTGCFVRAKTLVEVGLDLANKIQKLLEMLLHHYYLHGQSSRDWWRSYLEEHE
ncbi:hypothetical protein PVAP13_8NG111401 [Panicum virgatum]|uniref:DUF1618 domain-containing protein n=1 Tax=Panicum virgatum TaxID=38727 RepID=A0A8T0PBQ2_PANVG|nr:hypothetical protein PVAP13_8NG111401 [Panicum virgatum]